MRMCHTLEFNLYMIETWTVGETKITKIEELVESVDGSTIVTQASLEKVKRHDWLFPHYADAEGNLLFSIHAFIIEHNGLIIVVDTCLGKGKLSSVPRWSEITTSFFEDFKSAGFDALNVDFVLCTHLHEDHVGWNTIRKGERWEPTFPNAKYLFSEVEWNHWSESEYSECILKASIEPLVQNDLKYLITPPYQLTNGLTLVPTPGHTPGHISIEIVSMNEKAVITGDVMHSPVQCCEPKWEGASDVDPKMATDTRLEFLKRYESEGALILGTHFPTPSAGKIKRYGNAWRFSP